MKVGLFIPCYVDQCYPDVGLATVEVLERLGVEVEYPPDQTCCGQPMANAGCGDDAQRLAERFLRIFGSYEHVVCPSGSCVSMVRAHYRGILAGGRGPAPGAPLDRLEHLERSTFELCEFLVDVLKVERASGRFAHRVGLHQSCHGLRELRLGSGSERRIAPFNKIARLLGGLADLQLVELARPDECCGFGGTFAVSEDAVSCAMGKDRIADHERGGAEIVTAVDMSCLMHLDGLIRRDRRPLRVMHVAEILAEAGAAAR
ncbi:MAG TPA: (Fe-S)-binding protein [Kofleriaceae bacterium]|nr:(Fe-S)-binding protein [Kofleriaceae bacterium]